MTFDQYHMIVRVQTIQTMVNVVANCVLVGPFVLAWLHPICMPLQMVEGLDRGGGLVFTIH